MNVLFISLVGIFSVDVKGPGFRSGGPQRTMMNIVDAFGEENDI